MPVQQVQRAVFGHQPGYGYLDASCATGLILRYCVACDKSATEQCYAVATRDVGERSIHTSPMNEKRYGLSTDVDIHALALELEGGELASLRMFAWHLDGDVLRHVTPPACVQSGGLQRPLAGRRR